MKDAVTLRTSITESRYRADIAAGRTRTLEQLPTVQEWDHWRLVVNDYPYDLAFGVHDMLVAKRPGVTEMWDLNDAERTELEKILRTFVQPSYHMTFENMPTRRSAPQRYHIHTVRFHSKRKDMAL